MDFALRLSEMRPLRGEPVQDVELVAFPATPLSPKRDKCGAQNKRRCQRELELVEIADPKHNPFLPCDFVLYPNLTIYQIHNGYYYWGRAMLEELRQDFRAISREIRWDWDPAKLTAEMLQKR